MAREENRRRWGAVGMVCLLALLWLSLSSSPVIAEDDRSLIASYRTGRLTDPGQLASAARLLIRWGRDDPSHFHEALTAFDRAIAADPEDLDLRVELGDFFLSKYNGQGARETYEEVLAKAPEHPGALLGLARVRRFDGATDVFELTTRVLESDPDNAGAHLLQARQFLDLEDHAAADREAERVLESDAATADDRVQAHALLAASALLAGNAALVNRRFERLDQVASSAPKAFVTLAEVAARNRLYAKAVDFADRGIQIDDKSWQAWALRGINRLRTGAIEDGRRDLDRAFAGDPFDVWTKNTLDLLDSMETYRVIESERFQLVLPAKEADLLALYVGPLAEEAFDRLAGHYGQAPQDKIRLEFFPRHADFSVRTVGLAGLGALGVCFGPVIAMNAPSAKPAGEIHWGTVLWHELAHTFHMQASGGRVPRWFTEGLAVFEERRARRGWGDRVDPEYLMAYQADRLAPIEDLNQGFMRPAYPQQIAFSYLQSSLLFDFIVERWGEDVVPVMLEGYREGGSTPEVISSTLGIKLKQVADDYDAYFRQRFAGPLAAIRQPEDGSAAEGPTLRTPDADDFLAQLAAGRSLLEADPSAAQHHLELARDLFPQYAGGESPYWWLAGLHLKAGRLEQAATELETLVTLNQGHYPALRQLAELRVELSDPEGAAQVLEAAQYIYPYEKDDHRQLAEWFDTVGRPADAVRERRAVVALEPTDRAQAMYHLAQAQLKAGNVSAARGAVLEALEKAPSHDAALELLLELQDIQVQEQ